MGEGLVVRLWAAQEWCPTCVWFESGLCLLCYRLGIGLDCRLSAITQSEKRTQRNGNLHKFGGQFFRASRGEAGKPCQFYEPSLQVSPSLLPSSPSLPFSSPILSFLPLSLPSPFSFPSPDHSKPLIHLLQCEGENDQSNSAPAARCRGHYVQAGRTTGAGVGRIRGYRGSRSLDPGEVVHLKHFFWVRNEFTRKN